MKKKRTTNSVRVLVKCGFQQRAALKFVLIWLKLTKILTSITTAAWQRSMKDYQEFKDETKKHNFFINFNGEKIWSTVPSHWISTPYIFT